MRSGKMIRQMHPGHARQMILSLSLSLACRLRAPLSGSSSSQKRHCGLYAATAPAIPRAARREQQARSNLASARSSARADHVLGLSPPVAICSAGRAFRDPVAGAVPGHVTHSTRPYRSPECYVSSRLARHLRKSR